MWMLSRFIRIACIVLGTFCLSISHAATLEIDPAAVLNEKLAAKGAFNKERWVPFTEEECFFTPCGGRQCEVGGEWICRLVQKQRRETYASALMITSAEPVRVSDLVVDRAQLRTLPDKVNGEAATIVNCGSTEISQTFTLSRTVTVGSTVSKSVAVRRGQKIDARLTANLKEPISGVGGSSSIGISVDRSVTVTDGRTETTSSTVTRSQSTVARARPGRIVSRVELLIYEAAVEAPFTGTVVFDGPLEANLHGLTRASELLSEAERTIAVTGVITANNASDAVIRQFERKATIEECPEPAAETYAVARFGWTSPLPERTSLSHRAPQVDAAPLGISDRTPPKQLQSVLGTPGAFCYLGPCNEPLDGTRPTCYGDEEGACEDCYDEPDSVCEPPVDPVDPK